MTQVTYIPGTAHLAHNADGYAIEFRNRVDDGEQIISIPIERVNDDTYNLRLYRKDYKDDGTVETTPLDFTVNLDKLGVFAAFLTAVATLEPHS